MYWRAHVEATRYPIGKDSETLEESSSARLSDRYGLFLEDIETFNVAVPDPPAWGSLLVCCRADTIGTNDGIFHIPAINASCGVVTLAGCVTRIIKGVAD